jgi:actin-related protein
VPKLYLGNQAVLSLFATGRTTGTVLDSGEGVTHAVPIYEGYAIPHAIQTIDLSGKDLTKYLHTLLLEKHPTLIQDTTADLDVVKMIKEKKCLVAQDFDAELKQATEHSTIETRYSLPGDKPLILKEERIKCPELLFNPILFNKELDGIHKYTHDCIIKCDNDIRKDLFKNIVLAGGCTMFFGMKDRMKKEIQALAPSPMGPEVEAPADRKYSCWLGGAILS